MCPRCTHMHVRTPASTMCAHLPTCTCTGHTRYAHTCMCAHTYPHTCSHTHILCAHMQELVCTLHLCTYKHPAHRRACPHVHTRAYTHTHALAHVCTPTHAHVPVASLTLPAAGRLCLWCPSTGSSSRRRAGFHLTASPLREPICPCLLWTWRSVTGPAPGWQLCPLYPECSPLPPKHEARDSSPGGLPTLPGWRGAPFTGLLCAPQGRTIIRPHLCHGLLRTGHVSVPLSVGRPALQLAMEACGRDGWSEGPGDLHPPQPHWMPVWSPVWVAVSRAQQRFTQSQTRPPQPAAPSCLHSVEVLDLSSRLSPHLLSGSLRTSCLPWPQFSHL